LKNILILGGDGFCGWPTALHFSNLGHNVSIIDNLSRRKIDVELGVESLTPISSIETRLETWERISGKQIPFYYLDLSIEYDRLLTIIKKNKFDVIIHFAEQRAAPYSMKNSHSKRYTVSNNINATHNILCAIVESGLDIHLIHLGSMGVYGYGTANMEIPEGYLDVCFGEASSTVTKEILYPPSPGSIYHMTKTQDAQMFAYYSQNDNLRITDLHQGIVWGTITAETKLHENLINRFDYDGDYGTVLNRFLMQSAIGHPLTVHGTGLQTRAFIHITDTLKCFEIAINNPPRKGDKVKIFNQMTETFRVRDLANIISEQTESEVLYMPNPRKEDSENDLYVSNKCFLDLGLNPTLISTEVFPEITEIASKYSSRCNKKYILAKSYWSDIERQNANNETY